jgi:hypothetical protein
LEFDAAVVSFSTEWLDTTSELFGFCEAGGGALVLAVCRFVTAFGWFAPLPQAVKIKADNVKITIFFIKTFLVPSLNPQASSQKQIDL